MTTKAGRSGKLVYISTTPSANTKPCCPANKSTGNLDTLSCPYITMNVSANVRSLERTKDRLCYLAILCNLKC